MNTDEGSSILKYMEDDLKISRQTGILRERRISWTESSEEKRL